MSIKNKKIMIPFVISFLIFVMPLSVFSADESVLFTSMPPDALIVLDLSGSMAWNPAGTNYIWGSSLSCTANTTACSGTGCSGGFCNASKTGCNVNCSRLAIAKRAIFAMLDDNNNGTITSTGTNTDDTSLNIRLGYMRFYGGDDTAGNYYDGNIRIPLVDGLRFGIGTPYSRLFCNNASTCSNPGANPPATTAGQPISTTQASSGTPLSSSLIEAKSYLDWHKGQDTARECRDKFVILITDGADTYICGGTGSEDAADMYRRRRETVARAKALGDAGYKVFVIGFGGDMPICLQRTLNWAAYYGGTDNPIEPNSGATSGYSIDRCPCVSGQTEPNCQRQICTTAPLYPSGVTSCSTTPTALDAPGQTHYNICGKNGGVGDRYATSNDPATAPLSGYAFISASADELAEALRQTANIIRSARYSFTIANIASARFTDENYLYEASFTPVEDEPFWLGRLRKHVINTDGTIGSQLWDAGDALAAKNASSRNIKTYTGSLTNFDTSLSPLNFGLLTTNTTRRNEIVGYIRGEDAFNDDNWKLGDIWHSSPIVISSPNIYFRDARDANDAFDTFRIDNQRTSANGKQVVLVGANDGQLHVFRTSDGAETFSFIPPNLMPKLNLIAHSTHPTTLNHQFFVDGPITAGNVWLGSGTGENKSASDWKTMVVFGLGRGVGPNSKYLWGPSNCLATSNVDPYGFSPTRSGSATEYCGYYAFDFTNTLSPVYRWRLNPTSSEADYLGDPWSKMSYGRVKINGNEKWVGFIGGGGCDYDCSTRSCTGTKGRGFFVIDLTNGSVLWSYHGTTGAMPAPPKAVDTDNDGFIDRVYIGDLSGNMWRFAFCNSHDKNYFRPGTDKSCTNTTHWTGAQLYSGGGQQIYTAPSVVKDTSDNIWVYWGTGDKQCPALITGANGAFYAVKDDCDTRPTCTTRCCPSTGTIGWTVSLTGGEKILGEPAVFGGEVFFTSYMPWTEGGDPCRRGGSGRLHRLKYTTGVQVHAPINLGTGIPSAPVITINPERTRADVFVTMSGGGGIDSSTCNPLIYGSCHGGGSSLQPLILPDNMSKIILWRDRRTQ